MGLKVYKSLTNVKYNFLVSKPDGDKTQEILVMFKGSEKKFSTSDKALQVLIEETLYFKGGEKDGRKYPKVIALESETEDEMSEKGGMSEVSYTNVEVINDAIAILVNDFGVKETTLKTPDAVRKAAAKVGVSFPNAKF